MTARRSAGLSPRLLLAAALISLTATGCASEARETKPAARDDARGTIALDPNKLVRAPDPSRSLKERMAWAGSEARRRGNDDWAVVYTIRPLDWANGAMYLVGGTDIVFGGNDRITVGGTVSIGDPTGFTIQGTPLRQVVDGGPSDAAVILSFDRDANEPTDVAVASLSLAHDFEDRTVYVLGAGNDRESLDLVRSWLDEAVGSKERSRFVRLLGVHAASDLVVPELAALLRGKDTASVRSEAAEWLARHDHPGSFPALDDAARNDRSHDVRREATESLGEVADARGGDTLADILAGDDDPEIRGEAAEALGERGPAKAALAALERAAGDDPSESVRNEALEALVEMKDGAGLGTARRLALDSPSPHTRRTAIEEVAPYLQPADAAAWLGTILENDPDPGVRAEAVETLGLYPDQAVPLFRRAVDREESRSVLDEIFETALELGRRDGERFVEEQARRGSDPVIRRAAEEALESER